MSLKKIVVINTFWSVSGQISYSAVQLISNIVYARSLTPNEFGQLGIIMFFVLFSNVIVDGGLSGALVRKKDASGRDFSTVFLFNLLISIILYLILFLSRNSIANYYNDPALKEIIVLAGVILIMNSLNFVQNTRLVKSLRFMNIAIYKLIAVVLANTIGIILVIKGFGIWSMIIALVINPLIYGIILWTTEGPLGKLSFSIRSFKSLYAFGINTTLATIIDTAFNNIYQLILGKFFSISQVGLFYQAKKLQDVPNFIAFGTTNSVIFSSLSRLQDNKEHFIRTYHKIISYFSVGIGLISLITAIYSKEILEVLFGEKWIPASFYLTILAAASFFYIHEMFNRVIFKTFDRTKLILRLELIKKSIFILTIIIGLAYMNIKILIIGYFIASCISYFINYFVTYKILDTNKWKELVSVLKVILVCVSIFISFSYLRSIIYLSTTITLFSVPIIVLIYYLLIKLAGIEINLKELKLSRIFNQI